MTLLLAHGIERRRISLSHLRCLLGALGLGLRSVSTMNFPTVITDLGGDTVVMMFSLHEAALSHLLQ